jgi:predicted HTH transcriptional regulator
MPTNNNMNVHSKIIEVIKRERVVTSSEIAENFKMSWNTAEKHLLEMVIEGKVEKIKKLGVNLWIIKK